MDHSAAMAAILHRFTAKCNGPLPYTPMQRHSFIYIVHACTNCSLLKFLRKGGEVLPTTTRTLDRLFGSDHECLETTIQVDSHEC